MLKADFWNRTACEAGIFPGRLGGGLQMLVSHLGRFSVICTATRLGSAWRGSARIKPSEGAPEPFSESPTYLASATFRSEAAAEAAVQKEVMAVMRKLADQGRALDSLLAESGMRNDAKDREEDFF